MISRFEKVILAMLAVLGAGYWGYGLLLLISVPGDYNYYTNRSDWLLAVLESIIGATIFLAFEALIIKNRVNVRRKAWPLFMLVLVSSILVQYIGT